MLPPILALAVIQLLIGLPAHLVIQGPDLFGQTSLVASFTVGTWLCARLLRIVFKKFGLLGFTALSYATGLLLHLGHMTWAARGTSDPRPGTSGPSLSDLSAVQDLLDLWARSHLSAIVFVTTLFGTLTVWQCIDAPRGVRRRTR